MWHLCDPAVELAPNGPGSIDVVELDAATHGLIDDARDLREKAHFTPDRRHASRSTSSTRRTSSGRARPTRLLKLIEEPPPHLKFIFATTAPDKILAPSDRARTTIRSG